MNKKIFFTIIILVILPMMSQVFGADNYINFSENIKYLGLYNVPEDVWGGKNHEKLRNFHNKYMNIDGNTNGYLYEIALPGEGTGKVVLMVGMGKEGETCDYMLPFSGAHTSANVIELLTMDQLPNAYYSASILGSTKGQPLGGLGETTIWIGFAYNLKQGAELWIDNLGLH